jgi:hypothetical protein
MSDLSWAIAYKTIVLIIGFIIIFLGYKLFKKGFVVDSGSLVFNYAGNKISIEKAAAGIFFSVFGTCIILFSVFKGIDIHSHQISKNENLKDASLELIVDSSILPNPTTSVNLDSLFQLSKKNMSKKQYLIALKYLYFIKGITVYETKSSSSFEEDVNNNIHKCEEALSIILKKTPSSSFKDETRSTKIKDESTDSIR